ncbi:hypothetical protein ACERC5_06175 [Streptococcus sp. E24BD]
MPTTSTQAYMAALQDFDSRYIKGDKPKEAAPVVEDELTARYEQLVEQYKTLGSRTLRSFGLRQEEEVEKLKALVVAKDKAGLERVANHLSAIARVDKAPSDQGPRLAYMDFLLRHMDDEKVSPQLRQRLQEKVKELYGVPRVFESHLGETSALKEELKAALSTEKAPVHTADADVPSGSVFNRKDMASYVNNLRDFLIRTKVMTDEELSEDFTEALPLFLEQPAKHLEDGTNKPADSTEASPSSPTPDFPAEPSEEKPSDVVDNDVDDEEDEEDIFDGASAEELEKLLAELTRLKAERDAFEESNPSNSDEIPATKTTPTSPSTTQPEEHKAEETSTPDSPAEASEETTADAVDNDVDDEDDSEWDEDELDEFLAGWEALKKQRESIHFEP